MAGDAAGGTLREQRTRYVMEGMPEKCCSVNPSVAWDYCFWY
ncbi:unnamed protein product [Staurois parvus]|uniref:Uncharacterized protein n=1 Tax=Staurois parvus TaxID=386267 RepID=A0ABN9BLJ9_9NEOB|nr:unnamed protein product [Staurois parvus]